MYAPLLVKAGFHSSGNQILYNGMTGEAIEANIYIGPTYYMRLKHMVKDKINYRATGPRTNLTRQTVQGRANDGGLRIGEMERDGVLAHGMSYFLNESFLIRGDEYFMAVCNKTGAIAIYNEYRNVFLSPFADGPILFHTNNDGTMNVKNISQFGRSFSIVRIPYAFKLLIQELQTMNVQMRIITEENVDRLLSLSYSNNINTLLQLDKANDLKTDIAMVQQQVKKVLGKQTLSKEIPVEVPILPIQELSSFTESPPFTESQPFTESPPYAPGSPAYQPTSQDKFVLKENLTNTESPQYNPNTPPKSVQEFIPHTPSNSPPSVESSLTEEFIPHTPSNSPPQTMSNKAKGEENEPTILEVEEEEKEEKEKEEKKKEEEENGEKKTITL
jgi:hypothetical protein